MHTVLRLINTISRAAVSIDIHSIDALNLNFICTALHVEYIVQKDVTLFHSLDFIFNAISLGIENTTHMVYIYNLCIHISVFNKSISLNY